MLPRHTRLIKMMIILKINPIYLTVPSINDGDKMVFRNERRCKWQWLLNGRGIKGVSISITIDAPAFKGTAKIQTIYDIIR